MQERMGYCFPAAKHSRLEYEWSFTSFDGLLMTELCANVLLDVLADLVASTRPPLGGFYVQSHVRRQHRSLNMRPLRL